MKRITTILLIAFASSLICMAQNAIDEALAEYDFRTAETLLNKEITKLRKKKQPTMSEEEQLQYVYQAMQKMSAVERIVVFDSLALPRNAALSALSLSEESGHMSLVKDFPAIGTSDDEGTLFQPEIGDKVYYGAPDGNGVMRLFTSDVFGDELTPAERLEGLGEDDGNPHNYPYMMADGLTLYYAAQGAESLGGYDIFMTRYDVDNHRFLTPENVGMPFNSPANDYLLCIDETYNVGCFVTDRNMPADSVCVYYFIPNNLRRVYIEEEVGEEALRQLARLSDIRQTWGAESEINSARSRLRECLRKRQDESEEDFTFIVTDSRICHWLNDFGNQQARTLMQKWLEDAEQLEQYREALDEMRQGYAAANSTQRTLMKAQILKMESDIESLEQDLKKREKAIRKAELGL